MTMLSSSSPVAATTRSGGRLIPARSSTNSSVASPRTTWCSNSASSLSKRYGFCSISVTSWPARRSDRIRFAPTLPPPAIRTYIDRPSRGNLFLGMPHRGDERLDRGGGRADDAEPLRRVELRPRRVEHAHDHGRHLELLLGDLRDHEVRVVAVRGDDDGVRLIDPDLTQERQVHAVADREAAGPALAESPEGVLVLVEDGHVPAGALELQRDGGADAAAPDHDRLHGASVLRAVVMSPPAPRP